MLEIAVRAVDSARAALEDADVIGVASSSQKPAYNAGMSIWDTAILRAAYDRATANGVGTEFHLSTG